MPHCKIKKTTTLQKKKKKKKGFVKIKSKVKISKQHRAQTDSEEVETLCQSLWHLMYHLNPGAQVEFAEEKVPVVRKIDGISETDGMS